MSLAAFEDSIKALISSLEAHEKFRGQQTQQSGKVFFMWDFAKNTLRMSQSNTEPKSNVMQRCIFANLLFHDTTGTLTLLCGGDTTEFGDDVKQKSADCEKKAGEWEAAQNLTSA
ncbi:hypothetical protein L211DRAFT_837570 [Terfezia boudieri ATCC MYA-4762]|uniref:Uncharacterized protein n=1 Tax=Terfezia boudieri ATCC MYA-4762 TaxID=1051890 RepID=A0A3N4M2V4_9PEZI|nr:hypothetical protein L211DRAFT_837570 [Terfezia boudieri ATCC MYA-4762]